MLETASAEIRVTLPYELLTWQQEVDLDPHRFKVIVAGRRSGKTTLAIDSLVTGAASDPLGLGETLSLYVAPTYSAAEDIAWIKLKEAIRPFQEKGLVKRIYEGDMSIQFLFGQWIQLKGGDKPESLRGLKVSRAVIDEYAFMKPEVWHEVLQPATSDLRAPVMFIGSPCGFNDFYRLAMMETERHQETGRQLHPDWRTWFIKTSEAGTISREELERARRDMDLRQYRQEYEASFETFGGRVFADYDETKCVPEKEISFSSGMEYCQGWDFGWSAPTAVLFINIDAQENVFVFDELGLRETPIPVIAKKALEKTPGHTPRLIGCDPAGDAKNEALGTSSVQELRKIFGWEVVRYKAKYPGVIQDRVNLIRKWIRNGKFFVSKRCVNLRGALRSYRYPDPKDNVQSEIPLKDGITDHWIDALGEFFLNRFPVRESRVGVM